MKPKIDKTKFGSIAHIGFNNIAADIAANTIYRALVLLSHQPSVVTTAKEMSINIKETAFLLNV